MKNVLIVDNQISNCNLVSKLLKKNNYHVETTTRGDSALEMTKKTKFDIILAEFHLPDITGAKFFDEVRKTNPDTQMVMMGTEVHLKIAVDMIRRGANNFLSKPLNPDELINVIKDAENIPHTYGQKIVVPDMCYAGGLSSSPLSLVIGESPKAKAMMEQVKRVGPTSFSVVIQGETGTGKESVARLIHMNSRRKNGPFVAVDCGCLLREIAGSQLFGHEKGAFTGAVAKKSGFFEQAKGGTLFLDEISNLPLEIQVGLLRVLQEKVIRKVGGYNEIPVDIRIIAATNENLLNRMETSSFREDLYFRLCEYTLELPPLRECMEDLPRFIDFFLEQTCRELGKPKPTICEEVREFLQQYNWPGNIRELRNTIRRASLYVDRENMIRKDALPPHIKDYGNDPIGILSNPEKQGKVLRKYDLKSTALNAEYQRIVEVLEKVRFNKTKAAEILKIHRKTLYVKLKTLKIPY
ncbi:sigma-54-dependent transcriptional regulator [Lunatibacter salilacus]|uniref:sigma-54-dependent transcriptional regulator n=1 Tax=Lunatibacter salilacus TaxID=2483804 RepID=UPI0021D3022E|nr:sigma-54 dependent transcriptional regulator [Lunatibacter salilacus]